MIDSHRQFIDAIIAAPDDDLPRLVYADYLDEIGESERAEFIRLQCELEVLKKQPGWTPTVADMARCKINQLQVLFQLNNHDRELKIVALMRRQREILKSCGRSGKFNVCEWTGWLVSGRMIVGDAVEFALGGIESTPYDGRFVQATFHRGFIDELVTSSADWLRYADDILADHPLRTVTLTDQPQLPNGEWRTSPPHVRFPFQITVAGVEVDVHITGPGERSGRTAEWYRNVLSARWPGVRFSVPEPPIPPGPIYGELVPLLRVSAGSTSIAMRSISYSAGVFSIPQESDRNVAVSSQYFPRPSGDVAWDG